MCVSQHRSRSWRRHAAFSTSCLRCCKLWQSSNICTLVVVLNGWLESEALNHHIYITYAQLGGSLGRSRICDGSGRLFLWPLLHHYFAIYSKITTFVGTWSCRGGFPLIVVKVRVIAVQPLHHQCADLNRPTSSPELFFPTPFLFQEETYGASEECSPPTAVQHAGGRWTALRPPLNPPLIVLDLNKTQLI